MSSYINDLLAGLLVGPTLVGESGWKDTPQGDTLIARHTFTRKGIFGRALGWIMPPSPAAPSTGVPLRAGGKHYQDEIFAVGGSAVDETMVYASVVNGDGNNTLG